MRQSETVRCRLGIHAWTVVPPDVRAHAVKLGITKPLDLYAGRQSSAYCWRCGIKR